MKNFKLIFATIILCIIAFIIGYYLTLSLDKLKSGDDVNIKVTFEDTEKFSIPSVKKMSEEEALKEWPYIVHIENTGNDKGLYQIIIKEDETDIKKEDLKYLLNENDKEVSKGNINDIKNNVLYESEINGKEEKEYKLYIYCSKDYLDESFSYKLEFNVIKSGGPGF